MDPKDFIDLSQALCKQINHEAALRSAVSRSYFGLYNLLYQFLVSHGISLSNGADAHKKTCHCFHNCNFTDIEKLALILEDLRRERNRADYNLSIDKFRDPNVASMTTIKARAAFNDFIKITSDHTNRNTIINGIKTYLETKNFTN